MDPIFFDGWNSLIRTLIVGIMAYGFLVAFLRISGKRTLSKMNAFDWVVTVALGSTLATILLNKEVTLAQGALALALLIGMQFAVTWCSLRAKWVRAVVAAEPALLLYRGAFLRGKMHSERVTEEDVYSAVRASGVGSLGEVEAVVLETDGSFSVLPFSQGGHSGQSSFDWLEQSNESMSERNDGTRDDH